MAIAKLNFSRNWENPEDFPTVETDEVKVRQDLQYLHDEIRKYINDTLLPGIQKELTNLPAGAAGGYYTPIVQQTDDDEVMFAFEPSESDMPVANPRRVSLPRGPQGIPGKRGETGPRGPQGPQGPAGSPGMSAYEAAQKGGYTGTEAEFYKALAGAGSGGTDPEEPDEPDEPATPGAVIRWFLEDETDHNLSGEYEAEEGMTWAEFVNSAYNAPGFVLTGNGFVTAGHDTSLRGLGSTDIQGTDVIRAEDTYYLTY